MNGGKKPQNKTKKAQKKNSSFYPHYWDLSIGTCGFNLHAFAIFNSVLKISTVNLSRFSSTLT